MTKTFNVAQVRDLLNQVYNEEITFSRFVEILNQHAAKQHEAKLPVNCSLTPEKIDELIASIHVQPSNFEYIAKTGRINGSLLQDLRRVLRNAASVMPV